MSNLKTGAIIKGTFRIFKENFMKIAALAVMIVLPLNLLYQLLDYKLGASTELSSFMQILSDYTGEVTSTTLTDLASQVNTNSIIIFEVCAILIYAFMAVYSIAVIFLAKENVKKCLPEQEAAAEDTVPEDVEEEKSAMDFFSDAVRCFPRYLLAMALAVVIAVIGGIMCFVPGLIIGLIAEFIVYDAALTKHTGFTSFRYCVAVIFQRPTILIYNLVGIAVVYTAMAIAELPLSFISVSGIPAALIYAAVDTIVQIAYALVFIMTTVVFLRNVHRDPKLEAELSENAEKRADEENENDD